MKVFRTLEDEYEYKQILKGWKPEPLAPTSLIFGWIHLRGCKIPSFFNFLKKKENAQKKIICTALALNHRPTLESSKVRLG